MTTATSFVNNNGSATTTPRPGQLFVAEDFAVAELQPAEIWDRIVTASVRQQASDVHLTSQADGTYVAVRVDGNLTPQGKLPADLGTRLVNHVKVLASLDLGERRRPQDGSLAIRIDDRPIDLRIAIFPTHHGEDAAVRLLDRSTALLQIEQLGVLPEQMRELENLLASPSGLILVTGATGAGKTTTLYALLNHLARDDRKIVTVENPIEYDLPKINQSQVNYRIGVDYATLVRSVLRQDPNVIMIGEVRDAETADAVVRAANSGRLVFATTHAVHAAAAVESLIALGAHPHFVGRSFRGVIAQTLVRKLCPYCGVRIEETSDEQLFEDVKKLLRPGEHPALSMGRGCPHCRHTGYHGRLGVFEVLNANDKTRDLIARRGTARRIYAEAQRQGLITIAQAGKLAALRGLTTVEELLQNVSEIWTGAGSTGPE